ncbi:MAG TPA: chromate efflux transporter [Candidatus Thermoplasmatota archaeon]|nr:chromate efflux transporter [Candidatus Thermoplasmatota archaeon]
MSAEPSPFGPGNPERPSLRYVFLRFLRYGLLAWGGPVAQIGMMHRELVVRDEWVDEVRFRKTLALYQALPGPEAHELTVWFGTLKRGRIGGLLAGLAFMLPGVVLVTLLAALYVAFAGTSDVADVLLYGVRPAVLALIAFSFWRLARHSLDAWDLALVGVLAAAVAFLAPAVSFLLVLLVGGLLVLAARARTQVGSAWAFVLAAGTPFVTLATLGALALLSLKVGLLTFGGAYTAIPFLREGAVAQQGWMTDDQFLDALALAGLVPGPLIAIGTFVGYVAAGWLGALVATVLIFAPAFAFTLVGHDFFERVVHEPRLHAFLLGVTAAAVGLILAASVPLARAALVDPATIGIALAALMALASKRVPVPLVLLGAAALGAGALALP